jgi:hypothetical protein
MAPHAARPSTDGKLAAAMHNRFNIYVVTPLVLLTFWALFNQTAASHAILAWLTLTYAAADTLYIVLVPHCQPSATRRVTILLHHAATIWLTLHPCMHPEDADLTPLFTIVEINTLILTLKNALKWRWLTPAFYATWIAMRLFWYPYLVWRFDGRVRDGPLPCNVLYLQTVGSVCVLSALNWFWTAEVVANVLRSMTRTKEQMKAD